MTSENRRRTRRFSDVVDQVCPIHSGFATCVQRARMAASFSPPRAHQVRILRPAFRLRRADDQHVDARLHRGEAHRHTRRPIGIGALARVAAGEVVLQHLQSIPVLDVVAVTRMFVVTPRRVRDRTLCDDAHLLVARERQRQLDAFLIRDVHRGLKRVETPALDGPARCARVTAVADVARLAGLFRRLERVDALAFLQFLERARVELDQVHHVGLQSFQTALDRTRESVLAPVRAAPSLGPVTALREQEELLAPMSDRVRDLDFGLRIALGGIDDVQPGIERSIQQLVDDRLLDAAVPDLGAPEPEHGDVHVGRAEPPLLERVRGNRVLESK
jgi:hypothetical protein